MRPVREFPFGQLWRDGVVVAVICIACALITTIIVGDLSRFASFLVVNVLIGGIAFLIIDVVRLLMWEGSIPTRRPLFFAVILIGGLIGQAVGTVLAGRILNFPPPTLGNMAAGLPFTLIMAAAAILHMHNRDSLARARAVAAEEKARTAIIERQALQAQLQLLQAQIEPHMLFNTLANLQGMISIDAPAAQRMLDQLIQYLRATLSSSRAEVTTLAQEFTLLEAYLGLMSVRMGPRLAYTLTLPDALRRATVPPMLLQPLVENAIIHGLEPKVEGGHVTVRAHFSQGLLTLDVSDTGLGPDAPPIKTGTRLGLSNTQERLKALFGDHGKLTLDANVPHGAVARLTFPLELT